MSKRMSEQSNKLFFEDNELFFEDDTKVEAWRTICYNRHGYRPSMLPVPIEEFVHDEGYCIIGVDAMDTEFELDTAAKTVTVSSLNPSPLRRVYLAMAYYFMMTGREITEDTLETAQAFAQIFLIPENTPEYLNEECPSMGWVDTFQIIDAPAYMIINRLGMSAIGSRPTFYDPSVPEVE